MRLRGQRIALSHSSTLVGTISDMDGRCKWLIGTLHLMVRKMKDSLMEEAKECESRPNPQENGDELIRHIQGTTKNILARVAELHKQIEHPREKMEEEDIPPPEWLQGQAGRAAGMARSLADKEEERQWLEATITKIAMKELARCPSGERTWDEGIADQISKVGNQCEEKIPSTITRNWKRTLEECPTLEKLASTIEDSFEVPQPSITQGYREGLEIAKNRS